DQRLVLVQLIDSLTGNQTLAVRLQRPKQTSLDTLEFFRLIWVDIRLSWFSFLGARCKMRSKGLQLLLQYSLHQIFIVDYNPFLSLPLIVNDYHYQLIY